ncbi:MAG: hypothetical protein BJ554DRAFT_3470 [Olpidium bornovanus]|uniref:DDE-1 domain-containing protein n=1 Tax=Olpidium bornovanus TaxID=278681 RepID=A0A8H7ZP58_9FUNG|nr:MAG: hypothetical protein BJ554DRAFT_3470 [Olpidium bornovanus]
MRITIAFTVNADGSNKLPPFFTGHAKPRCFERKTAIQLSFVYKSNKKAWMTGFLFHECIKIWALPPNTTPKVQSMDAGIISVFKKRYRGFHLQNTLDRDERNELNLYKVDQLTAMRWSLTAWSEITTIKNRIHHTGLMDGPAERQEAGTGAAVQERESPGDIRVIGHPAAVPADTPPRGRLCCASDRLRRRQAGAIAVAAAASVWRRWARAPGGPAMRGTGHPAGLRGRKTERERRKAGWKPKEVPVTFHSDSHWSFCGVNPWYIAGVLLSGVRPLLSDGGAAFRSGLTPAAEKRWTFRASAIAFAIPRPHLRRHRYLEVRRVGAVRYPETNGKGPLGEEPGSGGKGLLDEIRRKATRRALQVRQPREKRKRALTENCAERLLTEEAEVVLLEADRDADRDANRGDQPELSSETSMPSGENANPEADCNADHGSPDR